MGTVTSRQIKDIRKTYAGVDSKTRPIIQGRKTKAFLNIVKVY